MNQTLIYKIRTSDNVELFDSLIYRYTGLFYDLYNNMELSVDKGFINDCLTKFNVDKTLYDYCLVDVKMTIDSNLEIKKDNIELLEKINSSILKLQKEKFLTKKQTKNKKKLIKRRISLKRSLNKDVCFGGKDLLRKITKTSQKEVKTKNDLKRLNKWKKEFKEGRKRSIFLWGKACEGGNRKIDFHLDENYIILKFSKKEKIKINLVDFKDKKRKEIVSKLDGLVKDGQIPLTVRISKKTVNITFDNEMLYGYAFDQTGYNEAIKNSPNRDKKEIRQEFYNEQKERKLKGKIQNRVAGIDLNPEYIGFSVCDVSETTGEVDKVVYQRTFDLKHYTSVENPTTKQRNKLTYEISKIYAFIFNTCKHYKVAYFGIEELKKITTDDIDDKGTGFNRLTKNVWNMALQESLIRIACDKYGLIFNDVVAAYTSFIGNIKYDYYDCASSSIEIGRRGYIKYKNDFCLYPGIDKKDYEKMFYLINQDLSNKTTWVGLYKKFKLNKKNDSGGWWRNKTLTEGKYLNSKKSNIIIWQ